MNTASVKRPRWQYHRLLEAEQLSIDNLKRSREVEAEGSDKLAAAQERCREAIKAADEFDTQMLKAYREAWISYAQLVRLPRTSGDRLEELKEPSLTEFIAHLKQKSNGLLFVKNYGIFPKHGKGRLR